MGEMGRETYKTFTGQLSTTLLLLQLFLVTLNLQKVACGASRLECNGTNTIGECLADHGEEFLMESETSTKLLAGSGNGIDIFKSLEKPAVCNEKITGNCISAKLNGAQPICDYENRCKHMPGKK